MKLYFFRHAEAEPGVNISDHDRSLTARGVERTSHAAAVLAKLALQPQYLFSSPRKRAIQTADILAEALRLRVQVRDELNFDFDIGALEILLAQVKEDEEVMLVGHEPTFSNTVRALTGGRLEMKKGGLARVDVLARSPLSGVLVWLIAPSIFDGLEETD